MNDELVMYILVNEDIRMGKGKAMGQAGHAVATWFYKNMGVNELRDVTIKEYMEGQQKKIVLKCPSSIMLSLEADGAVAIRDAGHTQLEPNTLTCVIPGIFRGDSKPAWLKKLRLY